MLYPCFANSYINYFTIKITAFDAEILSVCCTSQRVTVELPQCSIFMIVNLFKKQLF